MPIGPAFAHLPPWESLFFASYAAWGAMEIAIWSRDRVKFTGRREDRGSAPVLVVSITAGLFLAFSASYWGIGRIAAPGSWLVGTGVAMIWAGIVLRLWAVRTLGRFFRVTVSTHDDHRLIDHGPYRWLRNPAYTGAMLTLAGVGVAIGNWLSLMFVVLLPLIGFARRIKVEEASLAGRFGSAFDDFRSRRWALVPFVW